MAKAEKDKPKEPVVLDEGTRLSTNDEIVRLLRLLLAEAKIVDPLAPKQILAEPEKATAVPPVTGPVPTAAPATPSVPNVPVTPPTTPPAAAPSPTTAVTPAPAIPPVASGTTPAPVPAVPAPVMPGPVPTTPSPLPT